MATLNGAFSGIAASRVLPYITYTSTQDSATNTSSVTVTLVFDSISAYYGYGTCGSTYLYCNGSVSKGSIAFNVPAGGADTITSTTQTVSHDANGNASITVGASGDTDITWNTFNFSTTYTLPQITRATTVTSTAASSVGGTSATTGGTVTDAGVPANTDRGVYWGTSAGSQPNKLSNGSGAGAFTVNITGLSRGTQYFFKAYSYNTSGYAYGSVLDFTTTSAAPSVSTGASSSVTSTTATVAGSVSDDNGAEVTTRGICYNTVGSPTTSSSKVASGAGEGAFSSDLTGLTPSTTYYAKAYATNSVGTSYGSEISFTTLTGTPVVTTTSGATGISISVATVAGNVSSDSGSTVTERGFAYGLTANPTVAGSKAVTTGTTGAMSKEITGLSAGVTYHFRAFATNSQGTGYGSDSTFTTLPDNPSGLTATVIGKTQIDLAWNKGTGGTYSIVRRGTVAPANINSGTLVYQGTGSSVSDTGLTVGTLYYYRVWSATTADWSVAYSASYSADSDTTVYSFTNPNNALTDGADYTTIPTNDGKLYAQISRDNGANWSISKELTFAAGITTESFGLGIAETWGEAWVGSDLDDGNFVVKLTGGSNGVSNQTYGTFGFTITDDAILTGIQVQVKAAYDSSNILLYFIKADGYYGTSQLPIGEGSLAYDTDETAPTFYDGAGWVPLASTDYVDTALGGISSNDITVISGNGLDHSTTGIKAYFYAHQDVAFGDVCFINASGEAQLIDADAIATMNGVAIAGETILTGDAGVFLLQGIARDNTWNWTVGGVIYGTVTGTSGNTLSQTAPSGTDDVVQIMGVAIHADIMYFNPQLSQIELA